MIEQFIKQLHSLGIEPDMEHIADTLWLAAQIEQRPEKIASDGNITSTENADSAASIPQENLAAAPKNDEGPETSNTDINTEEVSYPNKPYTATSEAHIPSTRSPNETEGSAGIAFESPAASALPGKLEISRAIRPLKRVVSSYADFVLDEEATIRRIAEERIWHIVQKPAPMRWLDVALVIDKSSSMVIWQQTILELIHLIEYHGAFRAVRVWQLVTDAPDKKLHLYSGLYQQSTDRRTHSPKELIDPLGQRLVLMVSDCISPGWRSGSVVREMLDLWSRSGPLAIIQMLPRHLWSRSALGGATPVQIHATTSGAPNHRLRTFNVKDRRKASQRPQNELSIPIVNLEANALKSWARMVAGVGGAWTPGVMFDLDGSKLYSRRPDQANLSTTPMSPEERVQYFLSIASPTARKLAGYLSAAPLNLSVIRLVQQTMLSHSRQVHLAEVFLSGLLRQVTPDTAPVPVDAIEYDFIDGVRDLLLDIVLMKDAVKVLNAITNYLQRHSHNPRSFHALLADPTAFGELQIAVGSLPFASVSAQVLRRMGGEYELFAERLEEFAVNPVRAEESITELAPDGTSPPIESPPLAVPDRWLLAHPYDDLPDFTGRAAELADLDAWLAAEAPAVLVVRALGGFGKSALTWHWLHHNVSREAWPRVV
jgi:hypothetical protein